MRLLPLLASIAALSMFACSSSEDDADSTAGAIRGGVDEAGFSAVGMLVFPGGTACNGTLVAEDLVLTAATCLSQHGTPEGFYTGEGASAPSPREAAVGMVRHEVGGAKIFPDYTPRRGFADMGIANPCRLPGLNVGLVKLRAPVADVTPARLEPRVPEASETCTVVGFGRADDGATGKKRSASLRYQGDRLDAFTFRGDTGSMAAGDSGAPLVCGDAVVGVGACRGDVDFFARVDETIAWIGRMRSSWEEDRCIAPKEIGHIAGDHGSEALTATGTCSEAVQFMVTESEGGLSRIPVKFRATLTSPPDDDFDLFVYESNDKIDPFRTRGPGGRVTCGLSTARSEAPEGEVDVVTRAWGDESYMKVDDARWITVEVRSKSGACASSPWELRVEGNPQ